MANLGAVGSSEAGRGMERHGFHGGVWHITARLGMVWIGMGFTVRQCLVCSGEVW
jgi:hypothetical protein